MTKYLFAALLGVVVAIWEVAVRGHLPPYAPLPALVPLATLLIVTSRPLRAYTAVAVAALIIGLFQVSFDLPLLRWIGIVFILDYVSRQWLTNRSIYSSVILGLSAQLLDWASHALVSALAGLVRDGILIWTPTYPWLATLVWDTLIIAVVFLIVAGKTKRFSLSMPEQNMFGKFE